jgi:hypothetical protein
MAIRQSLVTEWRTKVAHGETVGKATKPMKPRMGRKKFPLVIFCRPCRGLDFFGQANPRFHRGLLSAAPPALGQAGFESRANGRQMFEPVSSTMGSQRDSKLSTWIFTPSPIFENYSAEL